MAPRITISNPVLGRIEELHKEHEEAKKQALETGDLSEMEGVVEKITIRAEVSRGMRDEFLKSTHAEIK